MRKSYMYFMLVPALLMFLQCVQVYAQCPPTDHGGADLIISSNDTLGGEHTNIGKFMVASGVSLFVDPLCKFLSVEADTIIVSGMINGNFAGETGGNGGAGGAWANGSGNPGQGGQGGFAGNGPGGGIAGGAGGAGGTLTQICGGIFCIGNRDGYNGGGGGGGAGSGGAYGGTGGVGGWGAFGSGYQQATGGDYGLPGAATMAHGTIDADDITWGSGGGGAGGGGGGWNHGTVGGKGGNGGAMVRLLSNGPLTILGGIHCNGENGQTGGSGGGESNDGSMTCSTSGYNSCTLCPESVFDASGGAGGGGGGGSGGGIFLMANGPMSVTGSLQVKGGNGGMPGIPNSILGNCFDNARGGGSGSGGRIKIFSNPCITHNINPNTSVIAGLGGLGVVEGIHANAGTYRGDLINPGYSPLTAGEIYLDDPDFCFFGDVPLITSTTPATGGIPGAVTYQWQYSITGPISGFSNVPGQTGITYDPGLISQTTWYRRKAVTGNCEEISNVVVATVKDCTSINEEEQQRLIVYPNPASNELFVEIPLIIDQDFMVSIFNVTGQEVHQQNFVTEKTGSTLRLEISLPPGNYFIRLVSQELILTAKLKIM